LNLLILNNIVCTSFCLQPSEQNDIFSFLKTKIFHIELIRLGQVNSCLPLSAQPFLVPGLKGLDHIFVSHDSERHETTSVIGKIGGCLIFRLIWYVNPHHTFTLGLPSWCSVGVCRLSWLHILTHCACEHSLGYER
jgi:hypothetical protein